ncbi:hypothetical protein BLA6993_04894 [Burkholderia lata]|nr:hypothetical protein BLA6993_04894 [Burkholderia lata]
MAGRGTSSSRAVHGTTADRRRPPATPAGARDRAAWSRRHPCVAGVRAACRARRCLRQDCPTSSTRHAACCHSLHEQRATPRTRARPARSGRRRRFAKRACSYPFHTFRCRRRGARAAAASIVGTAVAVCHAAIRSLEHRGRWPERKRRSVMYENARPPTPKSSKATAARRRRSGRDWLAGRAACRPRPTGGPRRAADQRSAVGGA